MDLIERLLNKRERLHPDLRAGVGKVGRHRTLHHPLIVEVPYYPKMNALLNYRYEIIKRDVVRAAAENNWSIYVTCHQRPYRLHAFSAIADRLDDHLYWSMLGKLWRDCENAWPDKRYWVKALGSKRPQRRYIMSDGDYGRFEMLPERFTIYRGHQLQNKQGLSWTLNKEMAEWFAKRFESVYGIGGILVREVNKTEVIAYFAEGKEDEVLALPQARKRHV